MKNINRICKHCNEEKELQNSHIIPKHFYKNNGYFFCTEKRNALMYSADGRKKPIQDGMKEYLYCKDCEIIFSKIENVISKTIFSEKYKDKFDSYAENIDNNGFVKLTYDELGIHDINILKKYFLLNIYRLNHSKFGKGFLGKKELALRNYLFDNNYSKDMDYSFPMHIFYDESNILPPKSLQPILPIEIRKMNLKESLFYDIFRGKTLITWAFFNFVVNVYVAESDEYDNNKIHIDSLSFSKNTFRLIYTKGVVDDKIPSFFFK